MIKLYQLVAYGPTALFGSLHRIHSKRVFILREHAEAHKNEFVASCTERRDDYDLTQLDHVTEVRIVELELHE